MCIRDRYDSDDALICSHGGGTLTGTYTSPVYDIGSSKTLLAYIDAEVVVTGVGNDWDTVLPLTYTGSELVTDGTFSNWTGDELDDWSESSCDASEDAGGQTGSCAKVTLSADDGYIYQNVSVTAGNTYNLTGYYKNDSGSRAQVGVYDVSNSAWIAGGFRLQADSTSFTQFNRIFTAPTGCTSVQIRLGGQSNGDVVYFDTVSCKQIDESASATWDDAQADTRTWAQIFSTSEGAKVEMTLKYGDTNPPTNAVTKMEILTAVVTGRYFQTVTTITDPSDGVNAYVMKQVLKLHEEA